MPSGKSDMNRWVRVLAAVALISLASACGKKVENRMRDINPDLAIQNFFSAWKNRDWKGMYRLTHPNFIQKMKMQKLSPGMHGMNDEELFIREFERASRENTGFELRSYTVTNVGQYTPRDASVWVDVLVNGRQRRVPLTLDGLTLKVDLTRIK